MRRYLPKSLNAWLAFGIPSAMAIAWLTGEWKLGGGAALALGATLALRVRSKSAAHRAAATEKAASPAATQPLPTRPQSASLVEQLVEQRRAALLLRPQVAASLAEQQLETAQEALDNAMAIVPEGQVCVQARASEQPEGRNHKQADKLVTVDGFFLDRFAVSNREYLEFVLDGGYEQMSLWDEAMWPAVLGFLDRTGQPGPRFWQNGTFPTGHGDHPVVGVSWYEASAFARWSGKRLPSDPEWIKAGSWPVVTEGTKPAQRRYPWGDAMDRSKVNLWGSGYNGTVPVGALTQGGSVNGVQQLVGNVWEWTSSSFGAWEPAGRRIETNTPLKSIRGGAFDTYFETQAHCQFQSGEDPLARKHNIGFRCALGFCDVVHMNGEDSHFECPHPGSLSEREGVDDTELEEALV